MQEVPVNRIYCLHVSQRTDDSDNSDEESIYQRWAVALLHICEYARIYDKHNGSWSDYVVPNQLLQEDNVTENYIQQQNRQIKEMQQLYPNFNDRETQSRSFFGHDSILVRGSPPPFFGYPITNQRVIHNLRKVVPGNAWDVLFVYIPQDSNDANFVMRTVSNIKTYLCGDGKLCERCARHHLHFSEKCLQIIEDNNPDASFTQLLQKMTNFIQSQVQFGIARPGPIQYPSQNDNDDRINVPKSPLSCEILKLEEEFLYAKKRLEAKSRMLSKTMTFLNQEKPIKGMGCALHPHHPMTARYFQPQVSNPYPMMPDEINPYKNNRATAFVCFKDRKTGTNYILKDFDDPFTRTKPKQFMQLFVSGDADYMATNKPQSSEKGGKYKKLVKNLLGTLRR